MTVRVGHRAATASEITGLSVDLPVGRPVGANWWHEPLIVEVAAPSEAFLSEWSHLAFEDGEIFGTWEWVLGHVEHVFRTEDFALLALRDARRELVAVLPLQFTRRKGLRAVQFVGGHGPICRPEDLDLGLLALRRVLDFLHGWEVFAGSMPTDRPWAALLGGRRVMRSLSPSALIADMTWEDYLRSLGRNSRKAALRHERHIAREHHVTYRRANDPETLDADMTKLMNLHEARWGREALPYFSRVQRAFQFEFARIALERGWLQLWFMTINGVDVAAQYNFRFAGTEWAHQSGRDPSWAHGSIGTVLILHTLRCATEAGVREFRFGRGSEEHKQRFGHRPYRRSDTVMATRSALGDAVVLAMLARERWLPPLRDRSRRLLTYAKAVRRG
jgi:CelD/BcsL family acetyltransferase involved in cellulose biosynthesis